MKPVFFSRSSFLDPGKSKYRMLVKACRSDADWIVPLHIIIILTKCSCVWQGASQCPQYNSKWQSIIFAIPSTAWHKIISLSDWFFFWFFFCMNKIQMRSCGLGFCTKADCAGKKSWDLPQCYSFFLFGYLSSESSKILLTSKTSMLNSHICPVNICIPLDSNPSLSTLSLYSLYKITSPVRFSEVSYFTWIVIMT